MGLRASCWWICGLVAVSQFGCKSAGKVEGTKGSTPDESPTAALAASGERGVLTAEHALQSARPSEVAPPQVAPPANPPLSDVKAPPVSSAAAGVEPRQSCDVLCQVGQTLDCGTSVEICVARCLEMARQIPPCDRQMTEALRCFAKQPEGSWECDRGTGIPTLKEGPCGSEQEAVARCVQGLR